LLKASGKAYGFAKKKNDGDESIVPMDLGKQRWKAPDGPIDKDFVIMLNLVVSRYRKK
jgi:hypothetical protein